MPRAARELDSLSFTTKKWGVIPKLSPKVAFGYVEDPEDPSLLLPVVFELEALERAKHYLEQGHSLRKVSGWLSEKTGRKITHEGLKQRVLHDKLDERRAITLKRWAESLAAAVKKAKAYDQRFGNSTEWYDSLVSYLLEKTES